MGGGGGGEHEHEIRKGVRKIKETVSRSELSFLLRTLSNDPD